MLVTDVAGGDLVELLVKIGFARERTGMEEAVARVATAEDMELRKGTQRLPDVQFDVRIEIDDRLRVKCCDEHRLASG
jgi:hypothetical protein